MQRYRAPVSYVLRAALAVACIAAHFGATAHFALVEHEVCAEHGEVVDVGAAHAHYGPHATSVEPSGAASAIGSSSGTDSHTTHEHCSIACDRRDGAALIASRFVTAVLPSALPAAGPVRQTAPPAAIAILALAPKVSPPA